ncbi:hypothetical protein [Sandaracinus amylolyticus]|uniref:hypothetical protein n=1 Tax=Sandaracinus amylolyticus TaxID=927083 RepID=UPI001F45F41B|nr:hypothetical protein [Sandaracinus amylolyticus]UJR79656.1 Hypothetical protein I5071_16940 [Sandaracinus amylolyticus]
MGDTAKVAAGRRKRHWALGCGGAIAIVALVLTGAFIALDRPRPHGVAGDEAELLADSMLGALRSDAWERTGAIRWTFGPSGTRHLWDRERDWARVRAGDLEVLVDLDDPSRGIATRGGVRLAGSEARRAIRDGWAQWINDSFWLIAPYKARDRGTTRSIVRVEGRSALLVEYASGGVTPGDAYLWLLDDDGTPRAWRMWVSVLPVGGVETSWEGWITLPTGARVATRHEAGPFTLELSDVAGAAHLSELEPGPDPFAALAAEIEP